jgi:hypothetical protein
MRGQNQGANWRIGFEQSFTQHFHYFMHVYFLLAPFVRSLPTFRIRKAQTDTSFGITSSLTLVTMALPTITILAKQFFDVSTKKIVPADIFNLLTPVALAH